MTRIRYTSNEVTGFFVSNEKFITPKGQLQVTIDVATLSFKVTNETGETMVSGNGKNFMELKKLAKEALRSFGVNFNDEVRTKRASQTTEVVGEVVNA